ncbi:MAG: hypothetical protein ACREAM_19845, partial [Blastocatellia bacterium]
HDPKLFTCARFLPPRSGLMNLAVGFNYIENQREQRQQKTFQEEYLDFLKRHGIDYDERYVWG